MDEIPSSLMSILDSIASEVHLPYVFIDEEAGSVADVLRVHQASVVEINQLLEGYVSCRESATNYLMKLKEAMRATGPSQAPLASSDEMTIRDRQIKLCGSVASMHLQFMMFLGKYMGMLNSIAEAIRHSSLLHDYSEQVIAAFRTFDEAACDPSIPFKHIDCTTLSKQRALQYLESNIQNAQVKQAIVLLRGGPLF